ncbi:MAG TPA: hypothetical protein VGF51_07650 [Acidimicrobiales bacterium]|jgi:hypothetical protein
MSEPVDLDELSADDLAHLLAIARENERRRGDERGAYLAELLWDRPALGAYRNPVRPPLAPGTPPTPHRKKGTP